MEQVTLIYDPLQEQTALGTIIPGLPSLDITPVAYSAKHRNIAPESRILTYLPDELLTEILMMAANKGCSIAILPHPMLREGRQGFGISGDLQEAMEDIRSSVKSIKADLLLCNGHPVINKVVIGDSLSLLSGTVARNRLMAALERIKNLFSQAQSYLPQAFTLTVPDKPPLKTAALGIIAVLHTKSSVVARQLLRDSYINDARMHSLILAPKSLMQLIRFYLLSISNNVSGQRLPSFIGHIKSREMLIENTEAIDYALDGVLMSAKSIELRVLEDAIKLVPGRYLSTENSAGEATEVYRIDHLPQGEAYLQEIVNKPLTWIYHASTEQFRDLFKTLRENARATSPFLTLMVLSTLLATLGLFSNSSPVIIGAMILAPLMAPIISLSMGVLRQEQKLIYGSAKTIGLGLLLSYVAAILLTLVTPLQTMNEEIMARIRPNLLDLGVAILSGVAGAYAHARKEVAKTLAGVAIAVALVPPLSVSGIGIGWGDWEVFSGALLLFTTNLTGIILAGSFTFMLLGFSPFQLARKGLLVSLLVVLLISLPLGFGFVQMVQENRIMRSLRDYRVKDMVVREVKVVKSGDPMLLNVRVVSDNPITTADLEQVQQAVAAKLGRPVQLEITVSMMR